MNAVNDEPGAVKIFISSLMQLYPFPVKFFFDYKFRTAHLPNSIFNLFGRSLTKHGRKRIEKLNGFVLNQGKYIREDRNGFLLQHST